MEIGLFVINVIASIISDVFRKHSRRYFFLITMNFVNGITVISSTAPFIIVSAGTFAQLCRSSSADHYRKFSQRAGFG